MPLKYPILFAALSFVLTTMTQSCATFSFYHPEKSFHPVVTKEKDIQAEAGLYSTDHFSGFVLQGAYGLPKNGFILFSGDLSSRTTEYLNTTVFDYDSMRKKDLRIQQKSGHFRLGYGFYKPISDNWSIGAQGALGYGGIDYRCYDINNSAYPNAIREVGNFNIVAGGFIRYTRKYFNFSFAPNIYTTSFTKVLDFAPIAKNTSYEHDLRDLSSGNIYAFLEPSLQLSFGLEKFKIFVNLTPSYALGNVPFTRDEGNISAGFITKLNWDENKVSEPKK